jgi:ParB-like chromosome segregation protein Spo0J
MTALPLDRIFPNPDYPSERKLKELVQSIRKD